MASGLLGDVAHVHQARSRCLRCCPGVGSWPSVDLLIGHDLLIRRFLCGRPAPFRSVRDLGLVSPGCPGGSGSSEGCSSAWLPTWLPAARRARRLMVFKSFRDSLVAAALTWAFSMSACWVFQDHPVYIPRGRVLVTTQRRPGRVGPARAPGKLTWSVAPSPRASGGTRCTRPVRRSVRRRIRAPDRGCSSSLPWVLPCSWLPVAPLEGTVKSDRREFPQEMRSTLDRLWKRVRFRSEQGKSPSPRGFSGFSPSSARAAGRL